MNNIKNNLPIELQEIIFEYLQEKDKKNIIMKKLMYSFQILRYCLNTQNDVQVDDIFYYLIMHDHKDFVLPSIKYKIKERLSKKERYHYYYSQNNHY